MKKTILALTAAALVAAVPLTSPATLPVVDYTAIANMIQQGLKQVQQYTTQLQQAQLQIQQFKNQVFNTTGIAQAQQIWQQSQGAINQVLGVTKVFQSGSALQGQLGQFQNVNYWLQNNPYTYQTAGSVSQKTANDAMVNGIVAQQQQIQTDAATLQRLQTQAGSTQGQKQALDAANELAALQQQQLLQVRSLLLSEQQAVAARNSTLANGEAQREAASKQFFNATLTTETAGGYHP